MGRESREQPVDIVLTRSIQKIMRLWEARALKEVSATYDQSSLVLRNALPGLLQSLVLLLSRRKRTDFQIGVDAAELLRRSKEHGRGRAGIPAYVLSQVIREYQILREVILKVLESRIEVTVAQRELITSVIEEAINVAATEFSLALSEIQDQFLLAIAHDLKSPASAVQMGAELIRSNPRPEFSGPLADRMVSTIKRMTEMLEELHDTSRLKAGGGLVLSLSECDLDAILREVVSEVTLIFGDCFDVVSDGPHRGLWHPEYLRRLGSNLLNNAAKFRAPGSRVTITLKQRDQEAVFEVRNWGESIPESELRTLFDSKVGARHIPSTKGWGLGLVLVKGIVDAFGGTIVVESTPSKGTRFTVTLPNRPVSSRPAAEAA